MVHLIRSLLTNVNSMIAIEAPFPLRYLPLRAPLRSIVFSATPAHRSAAAPPDFRLAPLRTPLRTPLRQ